MPAQGAWIWCSIFIASITSSSAPASTRVPGTASTCVTRPCIGARSAPTAAPAGAALPIRRRSTVASSAPSHCHHDASPSRTQRASTGRPSMTACTVERLVRARPAMRCVRTGVGAPQCALRSPGVPRSCHASTASPSAIGATVSTWFDDVQPAHSAGGAAGASVAWLAAASACSQLGAGVARAASSPKCWPRNAVLTASPPNAGWRSTRARNARFVVTPRHTVRSSAPASCWIAAARVGACAITFASIES